MENNLGKFDVKDLDIKADFHGTIIVVNDYSGIEVSYIIRDGALICINYGESEIK